VLEILIRLQVDGPTAIWGLGNDPPKLGKIKDEIEKHLAVEKHLVGESVNVDGRWVVVIDSAQATSVGAIEQQHENEQVRRLRREGRCPCCGAEPSSGDEEGSVGATPREGASSPEDAATAVGEAVRTAAALGFDEGVEYVRCMLKDYGNLDIVKYVDEQINHDRGAGKYGKE
jgi:hypothetical protein